MGLHCSEQRFIVAKCLVMIVCAIFDAVKGDTTAELYGKTKHIQTRTFTFGRFNSSCLTWGKLSPLY